MSNTVAIIATLKHHETSAAAGDCYFAFPVKFISSIKPYDVGLWPERDVPKRRLRGVRKIGPGWYEVSGPIALAAGKRFEAYLCCCPECDVGMRVLTAKAPGAKATNFSSMWIKIVGGT